MTAYPLWKPTDQGTFVFPPGLEWMSQALCAEVDSELFYPEKGGSTAAAKSICQACPVTSECLDYALQNRERYGIFGGLSERERRPLLGLSIAAPESDPEESLGDDVQRLDGDVAA